MSARRGTRRDARRRREPRGEAIRPLPSAPFARTLFGLVFVSGVVALVYQSLWVRQLSLILGSTTYAVGTVLTAFMAGLGAGAFVLGRLADRWQRSLDLYAGLELAIGLCGLASPVVLAQGSALYAVAYGRLHEAPLLLTAVRFLLGFVFVGAPAFLMGGTLPVAARHLVRDAQRLGSHVALLYAWNTLGAAGGALLLPFVLLPALGIHATLFAGGLTNVALGAVAWRAGRMTTTQTPRTTTTAPGRLAEGASGILTAFFLSGFVALALEVVWNRFFSLYFGSSIYSYALVLFLYLLGIVIGGFVFALLDRRGAAPGRVFATCLLLLAVDLAVTIPLMDRVLYAQLVALDAFGVTFGAFQLANVAAAVLVVLPPTAIFGVSFPAVAKAASRGEARVGSEIGLVYLVNTAGTALGAVAGSFVLLPWLGVRGTLDLLIVTVAVAFAIVLRRAGWRTAHAAGAGLLAGGVALCPLVSPAWDARLMHTALSKEPGPVLLNWRQGTLALALEQIEVIEERAGVDATVSVARYDDQLALLVNGKVDATDGLDMQNQVMLGHLGLLVHPDPHDVLVVGMGSGVTLGAALRHPLSTVDLVEIAPEVLALADRHFGAVNDGALHDPRVRVHVEDARNFIAFNETRRYDVVVSEPSNPWMTGVANLFTDEFFTAVRGRLRPDGLLVQWFHFYNMPLDDLRSLLGTLQRHFGRVYAFAFHHRLEHAGDLVLLASDTPLDFSRALQTLEGDGPVSRHLRPFGFEGSAELLAGLVLSPEVLDRFTAGAALNSDDRPRIELNAPRALFIDSALSNMRALLLASDGARLPAALPEDDVVRLPPGLRVVASGHRLAVVSTKPGDLPERRALLELTIEGREGTRMSLVATHGPAPESLGWLVGRAAGVTSTAAGESVVGGHEASRFETTGDHRPVVAWTCDASQRSYAAALEPSVAGHGGPSTDWAALAALRCH